MNLRESDQNPLLQGNFAPWRMEGEAPDLEVEGKIPRELSGTWLRNGPNPAYEPRGRYHWFDGDGMIHAIRFEDGRASYRNRWVQGEGLLEERRAGRALFPGLLDLDPTEAPRFKVTANTNVVGHAGRILALVESSLPTELVPCTLETVGLYDFGGKLATPMTAHPKIDPVTGEMHFFGYSPFPPFLVYHVADREGRLVRSEPIDVAWPAMMHDFAITERHVIFLLFPIVFDFENLARKGTVFSWEPDRGSRLGVMPRSGGNGDVRWLETDSCFVFHPMNAYDEDGRVVLDVARYEQFFFMSPKAARDPAWKGPSEARLHRWRLDPGAGSVRSEPLDDRSCEFPRIDERLVGRKHRYGYQVALPPGETPSSLPVWTAIEKHDLERKTKEVRSFGRGHGAGEPLFVPRGADVAEDDGWVMALVYDPERNASDFWILESRDFTGEPVARIRLPHRIPYGFHGNWLPA